MKIDKDNAVALFRGQELFGFIHTGEVIEDIEPRDRVFILYHSVEDMVDWLNVFVTNNWDKRNVKSENKIILEAIVDYYKHSEYKNEFLEQELEQNEIFDFLRG